MITLSGFHCLKFQSIYHTSSYFLQLKKLGRLHLTYFVDLHFTHEVLEYSQTHLRCSSFKTALNLEFGHSRIYLPNHKIYIKFTLYYSLYRKNATNVFRVVWHFTELLSDISSITELHNTSQP